jgi:hypothetical protein
MDSFRLYRQIRYIGGWNPAIYLNQGYMWTSISLYAKLGHIGGLPSVYIAYRVIWVDVVRLFRVGQSKSIGRHMKVGDSVRKAINDWEDGELDSAMLHACNAIDGTASKVYPGLGSNVRFTQLLRENYSIFGSMGVPGIDLYATRWPVKVSRPKASEGMPDIADVIYGIHRCSHGHGDELPEGFELIPDASGPTCITQVLIEKGKVRLSDRVIFGLLAVAILSPVNVDQQVPTGYHLTFAGQELQIVDWWGRRDDFEKLVAAESLPSVVMDFTDWMDVTK